MALVSIPIDSRNVCYPTSTRAPWATTRISSKRLRSHRRTTPSDEAESSVLKDFDTARLVIAARWPNRDPFGSRSTCFELAVTFQTDITQSFPAVTRVLESTKTALEI